MDPTFNRAVSLENHTNLPRVSFAPAGPGRKVVSSLKGVKIGSNAKLSVNSKGFSTFIQGGEVPQDANMAAKSMGQVAVVIPNPVEDLSRPRVNDISQDRFGSSGARKPMHPDLNALELKEQDGEDFKPEEIQDTPCLFENKDALLLELVIEEEEISQSLSMPENNLFDLQIAESNGPNFIFSSNIGLFAHCFVKSGTYLIRINSLTNSLEVNLR